MQRSNKIQDVGPGEFRTKLCLEDVLVEGSLTYISDDENHEGNALVADDTLHVPNFNLYFKKCFETTEDQEFKDIVASFLYINPGLYKDSLGTNKFVQFIFSNFMGGRAMEKYNIDLSTFKDTIKKWMYTYELTNEFPLCCSFKNQDVFYERNCTLTTGQKSGFTRMVRANKMSYHFGEVIHMAAEHVIEGAHEQLEITNSVILRNSSIGSIPSSRFISKHMKPVTKTMIDYANVGRTIKTEKTLGKYQEYTKMINDGKSVRETIKEIGISKSTYLQFKNIDNEQ
tara:strand:+ start:25639 stop:26493 length:855 start_codon:yes stop_codon:yes gene_type:complete